MSEKKKLIYVLFIHELNICKIGISNNVEKRIKQLQTGCPYQISLVKKIKSSQPSKVEKVLHRIFSSNKIDHAEYNLVGEWFSIETERLLEIDVMCENIEKDIGFLKEKGNPFVH